MRIFFMRIPYLGGKLTKQLQNHLRLSEWNKACSYCSPSWMSPFEHIYCCSRCYRYQLMSLFRNILHESSLLLLPICDLICPALILLICIHHTEDLALHLPMRKYQICNSGVFKFTCQIFTYKISLWTYTHDNQVQPPIILSNKFYKNKILYILMIYYKLI